eukprot:scaffold103417_cov76-Phaeocystis_antarctica.AAC.5
MANTKRRQQVRVDTHASLLLGVSSRSRNTDSSTRACARHQAPGEGQARGRGKWSQQIGRSCASAWAGRAWAR